MRFRKCGQNLVATITGKTQFGLHENGSLYITLILAVNLSATLIDALLCPLASSLIDRRREPRGPRLWILKVLARIKLQYFAVVALRYVPRVISTSESMNANLLNGNPGIPMWKYQLIHKDGWANVSKARQTWMNIVEMS